MNVGLLVHALAAAIALAAVRATNMKPIKQVCAQHAWDSTRSVDTESPVDVVDGLVAAVHARGPAEDTCPKGRRSNGP